MKTLIILLSLFMLFATPSAKAEPAENNCIKCHQSFEDKDTGPSHKFERDIHFQKGLLCQDCHGGDPKLDDMDKVRASKDFRGAPGYLAVPDFCARCHSDAAYMHDHNHSLPTDQLEKYKTSTHGKLLFEKKDTKVANCISCHGVHDIGTAKMPYAKTYPLNIPDTCGHCHADKDHMKDYNIPTDQLDKYKNSVHGNALLIKKDIGAPACNDCHGNHGAAPPGVASLSAVCGTCHAIEAELFNKSPHFEAFKINNLPMCEACHLNHLIVQPTDNMIGIEDPAVCVSCHSADDGTKAITTAQGISLTLKELVSAKNEAQKMLDEATAKDMTTTDEEFAMKDVTQALIQSRTQFHSLNLKTVTDTAAEGLKKAKSIKENSLALVGEYFYRRKGLGIATLFITILAIGLYFKIREIEKK